MMIINILYTNLCSIFIICILIKKNDTYKFECEIFEIMSAKCNKVSSVTSRPVLDTNTLLFLAVIASVLVAVCSMELKVMLR